MKLKTKIIPAILAKTKKELELYLKKTKKISNYIHIDIADGKFVHTKTIDYLSFRGLKGIPKLEFHLMVKEPRKHIIKYIPYSYLIIFHFESTKDVFAVIREIKKHDRKVGIAINPKTKISNIVPYLSYLDKVMIMSINPGKYGQKFMSIALTKIKELRKINKNIDICVDGGINDYTSSKCIKAGANHIIVNMHHLYGIENVEERYIKIKRILKNAR